MVELAGEYAIPFVRRPGDTFAVPLDYPVGDIVSDWVVRGLAEYCAGQFPTRTLPHFFGQRAVGHLEKLTSPELLQVSRKDIQTIATEYAKHGDAKRIRKTIQALEKIATEVEQQRRKH